MSYSRTKKVRGRMGLGGAENCGADQQWDPNLVPFPGQQGQCVPKGSAMTAASGPAWWERVLTAVSASAAPQQAPVIVAGPSGMSTTTMVAIGAAALLAVVLIAKK